MRFLAFDLLQFGEAMLLARPYDERRRLLTELPMPDPYRVSVVPAFTFGELAADRVTPAMLLERVAVEGKEGLVAKLRTSRYSPGRRPDAWLKHALVQTQEVIVCGWRPGQNRLTGMLGGLLLGAHDPDTGDLVYIGDVGTGLSEAERRSLQVRLESLEVPMHPFAVAPPREDVVRARWVRPVLVGEVRYRQFTRGAGRLRHTSWRGLRADRGVAEVIAPLSSLRDAPPAEPSVPSVQRITVRVGERQLSLSNLDKVLYPADGFTKAEVINYYSRVAPLMVPHLAARPVTFIRFPDGVAGQQFFEKNVAKGAPDWLPTVVLASTGSRGGGDTIEYPLIEDVPALVWAANLAALELHVPQWRVGPDGTRNLPDLLVFDLDPGPDVGIVECARVAERLYDILIADGLAPWAKTSGSKGMQVYCGVQTQHPDAPSAYAKALAQRLTRETCLASSFWPRLILIAVMEAGRVSGGACTAGRIGSAPMAAFDPSAELAAELDFMLLRNTFVTLFWDVTILETTTEWLNEHDYQTVEIDTGGWTQEADLHRDIAAALNFPDYYGKNLNALNDCMRDVASGDYGSDLAATGFVLVLRHYDKFAAAAARSAHAVLDIFAEQARNALLIGHRMMCLVQSDDPRLSSPTVGAMPVMWNDAEWLNSQRGL